MIPLAGLLVATAMSAISMRPLSRQEMHVGSFIVTVPSKVPIPDVAKSIGVGKKRTWAAIPWGEAQGIFPHAALAYLDEESFQVGTGGLTLAQIDAVMSKRASLQVGVCADLAENLALELGIYVAEKGAPSASELEAFFSGIRLGTIYGSRLDDLVRAYGLRTTLDTLERDSALLAKADTPADQFSARTRQAIVQAAAILGEKALLLGQRHFNDKRVFFVTSLGLFDEHITHISIETEKWPHGFLVALDPGELAQALKLGQAPAVYLSTASFARSLDLETRDQRRRAVDAALKRGGPSLQDFREEILRTRGKLLASLAAFIANDKILPAKERAALDSAKTAEFALLASHGGDSIAVSSRHLSLCSRLKVLAPFAQRAGDKEISEWAWRTIKALEAKP